MSLSSLSAQLSAIHAESKKSQLVGSTFSSSRRQEDAIGRGLHYAAQVGHSLTDSTHAALRKASVMYPDSKTAADVPLTILQENAVSSLFQLTKSTGNQAFSDPSFVQTLCGLASLRFERGLALPKENEAIDDLIRDLLYLLSSAMAQDRPSPTQQTQFEGHNAVDQLSPSFETDCFSSCLHVLEYLVRRYELHSHSLPLVEHWLISLLPHHETAFFSRVLQLVDLASLPTWSFLRPYAATASSAAQKATHTIPPPTRDYLSRHVARSTSLVQHVAQLAKRMANIHVQETIHATSSSSSPHIVLTRSGLSHVFSFCAAVLVEALQCQSNKTGTLDESTVRTLIPYLLTACGGDGNIGSTNTTKRNKYRVLGHSSNNKDSSIPWSLSVTCPEYRGWGHILVSSIVELGVLSADVYRVLLDTLMRGALELDQALRSNTSNPAVDSQQQRLRIEAAASSIIVIMSVLVQLPRDNDDGVDSLGKNHKTFLSQVGGNPSSLMVLGFPMLSFGIVKSLVSEWDETVLVVALGQLHKKLNLDVSNLVAALLNVALHRLFDLNDIHHMKPNKSRRVVSMVLKLIHENDLLSLWTDSRTFLTASVTSAIVTAFSTWEGLDVASEETGNDNNTNGLVSSIQSILEALRLVHSCAVDEGVAHAVLATQRSKHRKVKRKRIAKLLGIGSTAQLRSITRLNEDPTAGSQRHDQEDNVQLCSGHLLPPLVALEHSDANTRLEAVQRAVNDKSSLNGDGGTVEFAFLRRFCLDDDVRVALATGKALCDKMNANNICNSANHITFVEMSLFSLYRWKGIEGNSIDQTQQFDLVQLALMLIGFSIRPCSTIELKGVSLIEVQCCIEAIVAHLDHSVPADVRSSALRALDIALGGRSAENLASMTAMELFFSSETARNGLKKLIDSKSLSTFLGHEANLLEISLRKQYFWVVLELLLDYMKKSSDMEVMDVALGSCLLGLREIDRPNLESEHMSVLRGCLDKCVTAKSNADPRHIPSVLVAIASAGNDTIFQSIGVDAIHAACKSASVPNATVILETCLRTDTPTLAVERLLSLIHHSVPPSHTIQVVALLAHPEHRVRSCALKLIKRLLPMSVDNDTTRNVFETASTGKSYSVMDGAAGLPALLAAAVCRSENKTRAAGFLLEQCVVSACSSVATDWLKLQDACGIIRSASIVLNAAELAGEQSFPLTMRWKHAGEPIFRYLLGTKDDGETSVAFFPLMETAVRMLKGMIVDEHSAVTNASSIIISSGPGVSGTRTRSYSVGKFEGVSIIHTFPQSMGRAICDCLATLDNLDSSSTTVTSLVRLVVEECIGRESWGTGIFSKLEQALQRQIALSLLDGVEHEIADVVASAFRCLPFQARDLAFLVAHVKQEGGRLSKTSHIAAVVQLRAPFIYNSSHSLELITALFELLNFLSSDATEFADDDGLEFARHSILLALHDIFELVASRSADNLKMTDDTSGQLIYHAKWLLQLVGDRGTGSVQPMASQRARSTTISVLAIVCSVLPPNSALSVFVCTMSALISDAAFEKHPEYLVLVKEFLGTVTPVYCRVALAANLSLNRLFSEFVTASKIVTQASIKIELFGSLVKAIHSSAAFEGENTPCGALLAVIFAEQLRDEPVTSIIDPGFPANLLQEHFPPNAQLSAVGELVYLVNGLLASWSRRQGIVNISKRSPQSFSVQEIELIVGLESDETPVKIVKILKLSRGILSTVVEVLSNGLIRNVLRKRLGSSSIICLSLWHDLLLLQLALNFDDGIQASFQGKGSDWELCVSLADDGFQLLQELLPADVFLAAVSTLMMNHVTEELQARSIRLVAERVSGLDPNSAEASLFLEQVPKLVDVLSGPGGYIVHQSALLAIEKLARSLRLGGPQQKQATAKEINDFVRALVTVASVLEKHSPSLSEKDFLVDGESRCQLVSSAALACSTLVRVVTIRCIPTLPKLVNSLGTALSSANICSGSGVCLKVQSRTNISMVQISVMRAVSGLCESVPQFLGPYLKHFLSSTTLLSSWLHYDGNDRDPRVRTEAELLVHTFAKCIPTRQLIPSISRAISDCEVSNELCVVLSLATKSLDFWPQTDVMSQRTNLLRSLTVAYEFERDKRDDVLSTANELLLVFVLKLSEAQLASIYSYFREWRGELDKLNAEKNAERRHAFWSLSGILIKELKSLFLPCFNRAAVDVIDELDVAANLLGDHSRYERGHVATKKRKLEVDKEVESMLNYGVKSLRSLEFLLICLEAALKADARDGGKWVRADDGYCFYAILEPLGKLLRLRLPKELQACVAPTSDLFDRLVFGSHPDESCVVSCLTALAAAAGNEQLWKPLNHIILEACGNQSRSEVRKAGISCLLRVIRTVGDEYMVILPECLPVLSELMEDPDEEIITLAQECVAVGEELLGESLQDSLR